MPPIEYNPERKVYIRQCTKCKATHIGNTDYQESITIFSEFFGIRSRSTDGLSLWCRSCNNPARNRLGATREVISSLFLQQGGKCAICQHRLSIDFGAPNDVRANVDHDKKTGLVRGLLCENCNKGIGLLNHDPAVLRNAAEYVIYHSTKLRRRA